MSRPSAPLRRPLTLAVQGLVLALVAAGTSAYATLHKAVALDVNGQERSVTAFGRTVGDVLAAAGVEVGELDLVVPAPHEPARSGQEIVVRHAQQVQLLVDGELRTVWTTGETAGDVLAQVGVADARAHVSVSRSAELPRGPLVVSTLKSVTIAADGTQRQVDTNAPTVRDLLADAGVVLEPFDQVSAPLDAATEPGMEVTVTRAETTTDVVVEPLGFDEREEQDSSLPRGTRVVRAAGAEGRLEVTYVVTSVDGREVQRSHVATVRVAEPQDRVVLVGTGSPSSGGKRDADSLNWAALAKCESGGNPKAVSRTGRYHGLYQFSVATWKSVGGKGLPSEASPEEQLLRAKKLYTRSGAGQWPHCGPRLFS